jgi:hypothetical protein
MDEIKNQYSEEEEYSEDDFVGDDKDYTEDDE